MATLSTLMKGDLPPVGNPISTVVEAGELLIFAGYTAVPVASGTMSLALAMLIIKHRCQHVARPEVILPAYGCPDLVAAAVYAGLKPILVDVEENFHGLNLNNLADTITENTVAVIAVNFLGVPDRLPQIRGVLKSRPDIFLIEDNAQCFPELTTDEQLTGDFVCLSFGRGKPVSLLGGGALLVRDSLSASDRVNQYISPSKSGKVSLSLKIRAYNKLLTPWLYQFISRNPLVNLGSTRYEPLFGIYAMDEFRVSLLPANIAKHKDRDRIAQGVIFDIVSSTEKYGLVDFANGGSSNASRLLRYPVLCPDKETRDYLVRLLLSYGLGASSMYGLPLVEMPVVSRLVSRRGSLDCAKDFADRLMTLPVHEGVNNNHLDILRGLLNRG
jgi:dTDP-4-amino-4,6-dideoxygalactose transaminase